MHPNTVSKLHYRRDADGKGIFKYRRAVGKCTARCCQRVVDVVLITGCVINH